MAVNLTKSPALIARQAHALAQAVRLRDLLDDRSAENAFALATGFDTDPTEDCIEKAARRARYARRRGQRSLKDM